MKIKVLAGFCLAIIFLLPQKLRAQTMLTDSNRLEHYSYLIFGRTKANCTVQATGFLVKARNKTFLVTACHVINGWYYESFEKYGSYPDTLFLRLRHKKNGKPVFLPLDIRRVKNEKPDAEWPDVYFFPVNIPDSCETEELTDVITTPTIGQAIPNAIRVYGYRITDDTDTIAFDKLLVSKGSGILINNDDYTCDPFSYKFHYSGNDLGPGDSGAPVYFFFTKPDGHTEK